MKSSKQLDFITGFEVAEVSLVYSSKVKASQRPKISTSNCAKNILLQHWPKGTIEHKESFFVLLLNRANKVLAQCKISDGGISGTVADPKLIFQAALKGNASSIILSHNHPSGNMQPSKSDIDLTNKIKEAGNFLEIPVLDHIIISEDNHYSFADEGLM